MLYVNFTGELVNAARVGPEIDYNITIKLFLSAPVGTENIVKKAIIWGDHDGFPSYFFKYANDVVYEADEGIIAELNGTSDVKIPEWTIYEAGVTYKVAP